MFKKEMEQLIAKIQGSNELISLQGEKKSLSKKNQLANYKIAELEEDLRQKEDSIESLRHLKDTFERRLAEEQEENNTLNAKVSKLQVRAKDNSRVSQNLKLFKSKYETIKVDVAKLEADNKKLTSK
jgi:predicted HicB family RNase H-like nuclease